MRVLTLFGRGDRIKLPSRSMSTLMTPLPAGGSSSPTTVESATNCSGATANQPTNWRTPSASASDASAKRRIVDAATPTSLESCAHVKSQSARALSIAALSWLRLNSPVTICNATFRSKSLAVALVDTRDGHSSRNARRRGVRPYILRSACPTALLSSS